MIEFVASITERHYDVRYGPKIWKLHVLREHPILWYLSHSKVHVPATSLFVFGMYNIYVLCAHTFTRRKTYTLALALARYFIPPHRSEAPKEEEGKKTKLRSILTLSRTYVIIYIRKASFTHSVLRISSQREKHKS